jgi:hypothetical protein
MSELLKRLLGFLFPGVDDDGDPESGAPAGDGASGAPDDAGSAADGGADDDELEIDFVEDTPAAPRGRTAAPPDDSAVRLARLEAEVERRGRLAAEAAARQPATPDAEFLREEERLRAPDITDQERWQINSNRVLRDSQRLANQALFQAQDVADRTQFESKVTSDPRREKYRDRVEQAVQEERRAGRNVSRETVYFHMLGKDIAEGRLKPKAKVKAAGTEVPRGRSPGARSNVPSGRGLTEKQKIEARLANVNI